MTISVGTTPVERVLASMTLEKTRAQAAATLTARILTEPADHYFPTLSVAVGDPVTLRDGEGRAVFTGAVQEVCREAGAVTVVACDRGIYLSRNELYGLFTGTGSRIAAQVADALGIGLGTVDASAAYQTIVTTSGDTAFSILRQAVGDDREIWIENERLFVGRERGARRSLSPESVLRVESRASIRQMVNRAVVLRRGGGVLASREMAGEVRRYGQFQSVQTLSGTDAAGQAQGMLRGRELSAGLVTLGDLRLLCGGVLTISAPEWGLDGAYRITECLHRWQEGLHTTELEVEAVTEQ